MLGFGGADLNDGNHCNENETSHDPRTAMMNNDICVAILMNTRSKKFFFIIMTRLLIVTIMLTMAITIIRITATIS